jgi:hypothetical protein
MRTMLNKDGFTTIVFYQKAGMKVNVLEKAYLLL